MKRSYITNGYAGLRGPNLISRCQLMKAGMSANFAAYAGLPEFISKSDTYDAAYTSALSGGATERALRDQAKDELVDTMHTMAYLVMYTCQGDRARLISSGFPVNKEEVTPSGAPTPAQSLQLKDGIAQGSFDFSFKKPAGADSYIYEIAPEPITANTVWTKTVGNKIKYTFTGLQSNVRYAARVQTVGIDGQCACSETVSRIAQ